MIGLMLTGGLLTSFGFITGWHLSYTKETPYEGKMEHKPATIVSMDDPLDVIEL